MSGAWEGIGLFFVALCDSSFISLPEINDLLVVYFCTRHKEHAYLYALTATLGSVTGCALLYGLGRWKGYGLLLRKYPRSRLERTLSFFQKYGVFALILPALWPPPLPFKIFVLMAGILGFSFPRFLAALALARGFRYFSEASLAIHYGDQTLIYIKENSLQAIAIVAVSIVFLLSVCIAANYFRLRHARPHNRPVISSNVD
jgi:membrane protein YqaA with SNARE-associated domain